jgi:hypothetical protein
LSRSQASVEAQKVPFPTPLTSARWVLCARFSATRKTEALADREPRARTTQRPANMLRMTP